MATRKRNVSKHKLADEPQPLSSKKQRFSSPLRTSRHNDSGIGNSVSSKKKLVSKEKHIKKPTAKRQLKTDEIPGPCTSNTEELVDSGLGHSEGSEKMEIDGTDGSNEMNIKKAALNKHRVQKSPKSSKSVKKITGRKTLGKRNDAGGNLDVSEMDVSQILALGEGLIPIENADNSGTSDSDDTDWEEVPEQKKLEEPVIPEHGVDITLDAPSMSFKRKKREHDFEGEIRRQLNRRQKEIQELAHKVHLLCWIAHTKFVNSVLNSEEVLAQCHNVLSSKNYYPPKHADIAYLERILKTFTKHISLDENAKHNDSDIKKTICDQFQKKSAHSKRIYVYMFIVFMRSLGLKTRLVMSFVTVPLKPSINIVNKSEDKSPKGNTSRSELTIAKNTSPNVSKKQAENEQQKDPFLNGKKPTKKSLAASLKQNLSNASVTPKKKGSSDKIKKGAKNKQAETDSDEELSKHFVCAKKTKRKSAITKSSTTRPSTSKQNDSKLSPQKNTSKTASNIDRRVFSTDDEADPTVGKKKGSDVWVEVFLEAEEKWISVDVIRQKVHCIQLLYTRATHPVVYVVGCNSDATMKDVTKRYVPNWHSDTRKKRVSEEWWTQTLWPYLPPDSPHNREEDEDIARQLHDMPLPKSISEYKDHPLYALKRHILKFEGIYPPDAPTLGFIRGEPVYGRECVVTLRSREIWFKEARVVRPNETYYKIVKSRPKYDKMTGDFKKDLPLELFGVWQTEDYVPPTAENGQVPRNEYGNVDLFKPCMLPFGTVHLQIPALNRVARKLGIDCAPAVVGFDFHSGGSHPVHDGFVVCAEFKEQLLDAWNKEIDESAKRAEEKREKRVYGNWRRLIRGLLIRENLKIKYAFGENSEDDEPAPTTSSKVTDKAKKVIRKIKK